MYHALVRLLDKMPPSYSSLRKTVQVSLITLEIIVTPASEYKCDFRLPVTFQGRFKFTPNFPVIKLSHQLPYWVIMLVFWLQLIRVQQEQPSDVTKFKMAARAKFSLAFSFPLGVFFFLLKQWGFLIYKVHSCPLWFSRSLSLSIFFFSLCYTRMLKTPLIEVDCQVKWWSTIWR